VKKHLLSITPLTNPKTIFGIASATQVFATLSTMATLFDKTAPVTFDVAKLPSGIEMLIGRNLLTTFFDSLDIVKRCCAVSGHTYNLDASSPVLTTAQLQAYPLLNRSLDEAIAMDCWTRTDDTASTLLTPAFAAETLIGHETLTCTIDKTSPESNFGDFNIDSPLDLPSALISVENATDSIDVLDAVKTNLSSVEIDLNYIASVVTSACNSTATAPTVSLACVMSPTSAIAFASETTTSPPKIAASTSNDVTSALTISTTVISVLVESTVGSAILIATSKLDTASNLTTNKFGIVSSDFTRLLAPVMDNGLYNDAHISLFSHLVLFFFSPPEEYRSLAHSIDSLSDIDSYSFASLILTSLFFPWSLTTLTTFLTPHLLALLLVQFGIVPPLLPGLSFNPGVLQSD
jgi:hypothetical protein